MVTFVRLFIQHALVHGEVHTLTLNSIWHE